MFLKTGGSEAGASALFEAEVEMTPSTKNHRINQKRKFSAFPLHTVEKMAATAAAAAAAETRLAANEFLAYVNASPSPFHGHTHALPNRPTHSAGWFFFFSRL